MAGQFDLPSWLTTQTPWSGSDAFIKGSQAGAAIAANRIRAKALYVEAAQAQQRLDLAEREQVTRDEASRLHNEVVRTKLANDAADFETLRQWWPKFQASEGEIDMPPLHDDNTMLKVAAAVADKRSKIGQAAFAELMATPGFDLANPEHQKQYFDLLSKYKNIPAKLGPDGVMGPIKVAENLKRLRDEADSRISKRDQQADMAKNMGWVYPEDGSPPYLVDAKGGTHFAPFHAGVEAGFTPEKTTVGGVDMIHVSPNKWQVVNRPPPEGKMTDIEREDLRYVRKKRQELVDGLPTDIPKINLFGGNKDAVAAYQAKTNEIAQLTAKEDAIHKTVSARASGAAQPKVTREGLKTEDRTNTPPAVIAPNNDARAAEIRESFKAGKLTKEQALQQLRELGFQ